MSLPDGTGWEAPRLYQDGDPMGTTDIREILASLEAKFNRGIRGQDLYRVGNVFLFNSDLNLGGNELRGAKNVAVGIAPIRSYGVGGNNGVADWASLQTAFDEISRSGYGLVYMAAGDYYFDGTIDLRGVSVFGSPGTTVRTYNSQTIGTPAFVLTGENAFIKDLTFDDNESQHNRAILVRDAVNARIDGIHARDMDRVVDVDDSSNTMVSSITAFNCNTGVGLSKCNGVSLSLVHVDAPKKTGIVAAGVEALSIDNCRVVDGDETGVELQGLVGGSVNASVFTGNQRSGLVLTGCDASVVAAIICDDNGRDATDVFPGIRIKGCSGVSVKNSKSRALAASSRQSYGILVEGGSSCSFAQNILNPNRGPDGSATGDDAMNPGFAIHMTGTGHIEYANFPIEV